MSRDIPPLPSMISWRAQGLLFFYSYSVINAYFISQYFVMENTFSVNDLATETWRRNLVVSKTDKLATERLKKTRNCFPEM
jgi:hypothetical protein